ncbi:MAG TPA: OB-fold domain-containing protein [Polyangiaceae bacterium]|jgi:hypothetical protein
MSAARPGLTAPYVLEYTYRRSLGPVLGRFFAGLVDGRILGARTAAGRVLVPPAEYDPDTSEPVVELVDVGTAGAVVTWCWVAVPRPRHPLPRPFAWALVKLDGADTAILHAVDAVAPGRMTTGMRVQVRWRGERTGQMGDIVCFEPEAAR